MVGAGAVSAVTLKSAPSQEQQKMLDIEAEKEVSMKDDSDEEKEPVELDDILVEEKEEALDIRDFITTTIIPVMMKNTFKEIQDKQNKIRKT